MSTLSYWHQFFNQREVKPKPIAPYTRQIPPWTVQGNVRDITISISLFKASLLLFNQSADKSAIIFQFKFLFSFSKLV